MKSARQLIAALMLLAWVFGGAHVALEHGGELAGSHFDAASHDGHDDDDDGPSPADGHHHHDLGAVASAQIAKSVKQQLPSPQWIPLYDQLVARLAAMLRDMDAVRERSPIGDSPPDERASGWLLDCHTALPVRGPSFA